MKKNYAFPQLLSFGLILIAFLSACADNKTETDSSGKETSAVTRLRLSLGNLHINDQKSIFKGMKPGIRCAIWQDRLARAMDSVDGGQRDILKKIHDNLTPELYTGDTSTAQGTPASASSEIINLVDEAALIFGKDSTKLFIILTTLAGHVTTSEIESGSQTPDCNCNIGRNGMLRSNDCGSLSRACQTVSCITSVVGCGVMWLNACNGCCNGQC